MLEQDLIFKYFFYIQDRSTLYNTAINGTFHGNPRECLVLFNDVKAASLTDLQMHT